MNGKISVAMATYNGEKYIAAQLLSIINQTLTPDEIVIVDDRSTDHTVEIIKEFQKDHPFIKLHLSLKNCGPIITFREAITRCSGDFIALADQDDIWEEMKLRICYDELIKINVDSVPSIVFSDLKIMDAVENIKVTSFWKLQGFDPTKATFQLILFGNLITGCTIMMNDRMQEELNKMPDEVMMHDHWMAMIVYSFGKYSAINQSLIRYRDHGSSVTVKSKISLLGRVQLVLDAVMDKNRLYMKESISQAILFYKIYGAQLAERERSILTSFIALSSKSGLYRKIYVALSKMIYFYTKK